MSRFIAWTLIALSTACSLSVPAVSAAPKELKCELGPVTKIYGKTQWLVYSCDDGRSLVIISGPENPASPFVFWLTPGANGYDVYGEGAGGKAASDAANEDIRKLSSVDIAALIAETKADAGGDDDAPGSAPVYRLDARFHKLPKEFVADLLAQPPTRALLSRRRRCEMAVTRDYSNVVGYCVCFGESACRQGPWLPLGDAMWKCTAPFGFVGNDGAAVCAAWRVDSNVTVAPLDRP